MTDEELAKIKRALDVPYERRPIIPDPANLWTGQGISLVAEVERLHTENTAMREIVQAVAHGTLAHYEDDTPYCLYCTQEYRYPTGITHTPACPVTKARALLGKGE